MEEGFLKVSAPEASNSLERDSLRSLKLSHRTEQNSLLPQNVPDHHPKPHRLLLKIPLWEATNNTLE